MPGRVEGKVVVVAGGSRGIGRAAAQLFAAEGAHVVLLARDPAKLDETAAEVGERALPVPADLGDPASVRAAFALVDQRFGRLDTLLYVAGTTRVGTVDAFTDEEIAVVAGTNFLGPIYAVRAAVPLLRKAGGGDIVTVSSEATLDPTWPLMSLYVSTKAGLEAFTKAMTAELRNDDIRVSLFISGRTADTEFGRAFSGVDAASIYERWNREGYIARIAGAAAAQDAAWMAEALLFQVTRPRGQMIDIMQVRASR